MKKCRGRMVSEEDADVFALCDLPKGHEGTCVGHRRACRRVVEVSTNVPKPMKGGRQTRLWAFGYEDMADLLGVSSNVVRMGVSLKIITPTDLPSLLVHLFRHYPKRAQEILDAAQAEATLSQRA